jgi:toxin YhaV
MTAPETTAPLVINGWSIFAHALFLDQLDTLTTKVEQLRKKDPSGYTRKNATKILAAMAKLAFEVVPQDPTRAEYRQGDTLGDEHRHWLRVKFFQQYRLFFRYHQQSRVIIFVWVNDEDTKRAYASSTDAYRVFARMLNSGHPPDDWQALLAQAKGKASRLQAAAAKVAARGTPEQRDV